MSILFRCPCGRSMVVESDRAGAVVMCPNCRRSLKVPSGKGRGVELPSAPTAATTRTSRRCQRCGKDVPVDSQMCPHCKTILMDGPAVAVATPVHAAPRATARATSRAALAAASAVAQEGTAIVYGGARGSWFTRLSPGGKAGVLVGAFVFVILLGIITYVVGINWRANQVQTSVERGKEALVKGRQLETQGMFQDAYATYFSALVMEKYMRMRDNDLADLLKTRILALQYVVRDPKTRESVVWRPQNQAEFDEAMAHLKATYPAYRQLCLAVSDAGLAAIAAGRDNPNKPVFEEKTGQTMETYIRLVSQTTPQQRAQYTFQTLTQALWELTAANRKWDNEKERGAFLTNAEAYFNALKERVSKPGYPDAIW